MPRTRALHTIFTLAVLATAASAAVSAQAPQQPPVDPVVAEIRALRAELAERLDATIRAQLIVARLQLQEQRTSTVVRQLADVESRLRENNATREQLAGSLKMFGDMTKQGEDQTPFFAPLRAGMDKAEKTGAELQAQQADLSRQVAEEQARWATFNARLDELEQLFTKPRR